MNPNTSMKHWPFFDFFFLIVISFDRLFISVPSLDIRPINMLLSLNSLFNIVQSLIPPLQDEHMYVHQYQS